MQNGWLHCFKVNHLFKLQIAITTCDTPPLTNFWTPYWQKHVMESFTITLFYTTFRNNALENDCPVWLVITSEVLMPKNVLNKVVNFKDFSRPYKEIKYFSKTLTKFKDFSRQILKIQDLFKIVRTMKGRARYPLTKSSTMTSKKWPS